MNKKRIVLHMGHTKTGSSALQSFLHSNAPLLKEQKATYYKPLNIYNNNPGKPNAGFLDAHHRNMQHLLDQEIDELRRELSETDVLILSDETLFSKVKQYASFKEFLRKIDADADIDVIIYLREQTSWLLSAWKQYIKGPAGVYSYRKWLRCNTWTADYYHMISELEKSFGKGHIYPRIYDRNAFLQGNLFTDFILTSGLQWDERFDQQKGIYSNPSITFSIAKKKRYLNILVKVLPNPWKEKWKRAIWRWSLKASNGKRESIRYKGLSAKEIDKFKKEFKEGNRKLAQEYFGKEELF